MKPTAEVINTTAADWRQLPDHPCVMLALDPNNEQHFMYTKPPRVPMITAEYLRTANDVLVTYSTRKNADLEQKVLA